MSAEKLAHQPYILPRMVNVCLLDLPSGPILIDTGFASSKRKILEGIAAIGKRSEGTKHILLTHAHMDHIGSAAASKDLSGLQIYEAGIVQSGVLSHPCGSRIANKKRKKLFIFRNICTQSHY